MGLGSSEGDTMPVEEKQELKTAPNVFVTCYVTSKRIHSGLILDLRDKWPKIHFTAHWPIVRNISTEHNRPAREWIVNNVDDIIRSQTVLCYAEKDDILCGSIFELGIAWAHGKQIWLVGDNPYYKEWKFAPRIHRRETLERALKDITALTGYTD